MKTHYTDQDGKRRSYMSTGMYGACRFLCDRCGFTQRSLCYTRPFHDRRFRGPCSRCSSYGMWEQYLWPTPQERVR